VPARAAPLPSSPAGRAFTGLTKVRSGSEAELSAYLTELGTNIQSTTDLVFSELRTVHFCRWLLVRDTAGEPWLAFESNYDGPLDAHLRELIRIGASGIHRIYRRCEGYPLSQADAIAPADAPAVLSFLQQTSIPTAAFHVGIHGKTAQRIRRESEIRDLIETFVDQRRASGAWDRAGPDEIYDEIVEYLATVRRLDDAREKQTAAPESRALPWVLRALPVALALLPGLPILYPLLRIHEAVDEEDEVAAEPPRVRYLADREDFQVQNQLTHLVDVKPGLFRQAVLRLVLWIIDLLARYQFNQGALGGITTIHFARWCFIDGGKRLLFFSNYDGSWESYLGDFVDKAATGLTGIWSNTKGFPRTANLAFRGATDEERFKSWTRAHQVTTQLWYSAYPELTVFNIQENAKICAGLAERPATPEAMLAWLEYL
jgi:hypothetical protein